MFDHLAVERPAVYRFVGCRRPAAHFDPVQQLDGQLRERVRREGVDPQREALVVVISEP